MDPRETLGSGRVRASRACAVGLRAIFDAGRDAGLVADLGNSRPPRPVKSGQKGRIDLGAGHPHVFKLSAQEVQICTRGSAVLTRFPGGKTYVKLSISTPLQ